MQDPNVNQTDKCTACHGEGNVPNSFIRMMIACFTAFGGRPDPNLSMQFEPCTTCDGTGERRTLVKKAFLSVFLCILCMLNVKNSSAQSDSTNYMSQCKTFTQWLQNYDLRVSVVGNEDVSSLEFILYDCGIKYRFILGCSCGSTYQGLLVIPGNDWNKRASVQEIINLKARIESAIKNKSLVKELDEDKQPYYVLTCS